MVEIKLQPIVTQSGTLKLPPILYYDATITYVDNEKVIITDNIFNAEKTFKLSEIISVASPKLN